MQELIAIKEAINSPCTIQFLELDQFAKEIIVRQPKIIEGHPAYSGYFVAECYYIEKYFFFVVAKRHVSRKFTQIEIYAFKDKKRVSD